MIPQEYIQEVVARNDITDVIGSYVQLRHRGRTHTGLCPFHSEKTPSFVVYPETQSYYCFGCGAGGDVITFIRTMNNLATWRRSSSWPPGRECPAGRGRQGRQTAQPHPGDQQAGRPLFLSVPERQQRAGPAPPGPTGGGADCPTAPSAGSGWAGRRDDFRSTLNWLRERGFNEEELLASGLVKRSEKGNLYNIFRGRVMTPIFDLRGNVIAFGGRVLGG